MRTITATLLLTALFGVTGLTSPLAAAPEVTIRNIARAIERHIDTETAVNVGVFPVKHDDRVLELQLIRIHMEYLANLGGGVQFACVDLVERDGTVYDVDFFLKGTDPAALTVTETHVHKIDGRPLYAWEQKPDKTWHRVPAEEAGDELLGVIRGEDVFDFTYRFELPELAAPAKIWLPLAQSDAWQTVEILSLETPMPHRTLIDPAHGNKVLYLEAQPEHGGEQIEIRYRVHRKEQSPYAVAEDAESLRKHLQPERLVPLTDQFRKIAREATRDARTDLMRARELYNHVFETFRYQRFGDGWGQGDAVYACDAESGNCTDFHSFFIALSRAVGIPARFIMGAALPSERNEGGVDGYHCWAEFYADERWWPVDISEANKVTRLADYYFGRQPANRLTLTRGRDLVVEPGPASGPINFLAYPVIEVGGEPLALPRPTFVFERIVTEAEPLATASPTPWEYDVANNRHWHPAHGHWHPGPPPAGAHPPSGSGQNEPEKH